jgi:hypothetical protein
VELAWFAAHRQPKPVGPIRDETIAPRGEVVALVPCPQHVAGHPLTRTPWIACSTNVTPASSATSVSQRRPAVARQRRKRETVLQPLLDKNEKSGLRLLEVATHSGAVTSVLHLLRRAALRPPGFRYSRLE